MKGKNVFFCSLLLIFSVISATVSVKAADSAFPAGHPGNHYRKTQKTTQDITSDYGTQITFNGIDKWYTDWSPDGQWIAYEQDNDIFVISSEGGIPFNLTKFIEGDCYLPCFTSNSKAVTFTNHDNLNDIYTLEYINLLREGYTVISEDVLAGYWSHNGRYLVYRIYSTSELALYDDESGSVKVIAGGDWEYGASCFSPDDKFVITSMIAPDNMPKLFKIPVEGGEPEQLTFHEGYHFDPDFSPDGKWILYTEYFSGMLYAYNTETGESQPVFTDSVNYDYVGRFSPEGDRICYLRDVGGVNEVFIADFTISPSTVTFPDPNLEAAIRSALGKPTGALTDEDLAKLTDLDAVERDISDLTGIEHCVNLQRLHLPGNHRISDISPLSSLTNLQVLWMDDNQISDISPLSNLTNLQLLRMFSNQISDISPLSSLTNLEDLGLIGNKISDIRPLSSLTNLRLLYLGTNQILDISPLAGLKMIGEWEELEDWLGGIHLDLSNNLISDISPLVSSTGIGEGDGIDLRGNPLSNEAHETHIPALQARGANVLFDPPGPVTFPDTNLEAAIREALNKPEGPITDGDLAVLTDLDASERDISDLTGIEHCVNLQWLDLQVNQISDLSPLSSLANLRGLYMYGNQISDLSPLSNLTDLHSLNLHDNQISDISPLSSLINLEDLALIDNQISDINALSSLTRIHMLQLEWNQISDLSPLSSLSNLQGLWLHNNQISDLSPLVNLTNLRGLYLDDNQIQNISHLAGLKMIGDWDDWEDWAVEERDRVRIHLGLLNNQISDISPLVSNTGIGEGDGIDLRKNPLSTAALTGIQELQERGVNILFGGEPEIPLVFKYPTEDYISLSSPAIGNDGTIYIGSLDNYLYAINPDGTLKWKYKTEGEIWSSPAIGNDGTIYIGSHDGFLYAIDTDGNRKWRYPTDGPVSSSPAIGSTGTIYFGSYDNIFYAVNSDGSPRWQYEIGTVIVSSPAIGIDGTIYVGAIDGFLYAFFPNGSLRWVSPTTGEIYSSPAVGDDGTIYIGSNDFNLYAINSDLSPKWNTIFDSYVESSPAFGKDGTIYIGVEDGYLYALNPENGSILWKSWAGDIIVSSPAVGDDGTIYVGSDDWNLYAFSPEGDIKWSFETDSKIWSSPAIGNNGVIYVGSYDGFLYAIDSMTNAGLADTPWPKFRHDLRNSGRVLPEAKAYIVVTSPDGGENLVPGEDFTITWSFSEVSTVRIEYSIDNGQNWLTISEVPASGGSFTWSIPQGIDSSECLVRVIDSSNTAVSDRSNSTFSISPEPYLEITSKIGGEKLGIGSSFTIQWNHYNVSQITIKYSTDSGSTWKIINSNVNASDGSYIWMIPEDFSDNCKIMIADVSNPEIADESLGTFSITANEFITVTSPKYGDRWTAQSTKEITWEFSGVSNVKIELSVDNGTSWQTITASTSAASGSYSWAVPDIQASQCIIRITDTVNQNIYDTSDRFEIMKPELTISHVPVTEARENDEITFNAVVSSEDTIKTVNLFYDVTGSRRFLSNIISLESADESNYSVTLDVGIFTALGMEYFIQATDINNRKTRAPADVGFYSISANVSDIMSTEETKGGSAQNAYRMISIPLEIDPSLTTIENQLSGKLPSGESGTDWRLFRYSPGASTPDEYPDIENFSPGKAFWLIIKNDFRFESPQGTTVTSSKPFNITLKAGWNDIANPWMFDISWEDIENPSGADLSALYTYNGSWSDPTTPPKKLEPWEGYAVNNLTNMNVIIKLNPKPASNADKTVVKNDQIMWMLTIKAFAGEAKDTANHFGIRHGAMEEWDRYDHIEPPSIGEYVSVAFPHYEWEQYPYTYTVDFRPPSSPTGSGENLSWDFDVTTNIFHEKITIELDKIENLPEGYSYQMIDRDSDQKISISNETFSFISGSGITERHFTIEVGDSVTRDTEQYTARPGKFVTARCYPNPFNPATTIQYELSQPGHVVLSIFNSLGQRVQRYDIGPKEQGIHNFVFDATGMMSGLYFYRVDSGYASATDKMLFMK